MSVTAGPLRYVVLHHQGVDAPHFDLMFETSPGSALRTYRLPQWPVQEGDVATPLKEHRREYLDYQGPVSNNRGFVTRITQGVIAIHGAAGEARALQFRFDASPVIWTLTSIDAQRAAFSRLDAYD